MVTELKRRRYCDMATKPLDESTIPFDVASHVEGYLIHR